MNRVTIRVEGSFDDDGNLTLEPRSHSITMTDDQLNAFLDKCDSALPADESLREGLKIPKRPRLTIDKDFVPPKNSTIKRRSGYLGPYPRYGRR